MSNITDLQESSDKIYYRDFNNCTWKEDIDENCLFSKKNNLQKKLVKIIGKEIIK